MAARRDTASLWAGHSQDARVGEGQNEYEGRTEKPHGEDVFDRGFQLSIAVVDRNALGMLGIFDRKTLDASERGQQSAFLRG